LLAAILWDSANLKHSTFEQTKMCYAVYIGTTEKQQLGKFVAEKTELFFEELSADELEGIRPKIKNPFLYYVGSDTGCSCGFAYESENFNDPEEQDTKKSPQKLIDFIKERTTKEDLEFYCCWEGDWKDPIEESIEININDISLDKNYFELLEKRYIKFPRQT
jgi:hypothetical protein